MEQSRTWRRRQYINMKNRWNYGAGLEHIPYLTGGRFFRDTTVTTSGGELPALSVNLLVQRIYFDNASISTQYPFSTTKRLELGAAITHLGFDTQIIRDLYVGNQIVDESVTSEQSQYKPVWYAGPSISLIGDNSFSAFTSPVQGERYRLQYSPTVGSVVYPLGVAAYRRYLFFRPFTFALRGMSIGRYGKGAEDLNASYPIYVGDETLIRGYGYGSFSSDECFTNGTSTADQNRCPVFDRIFGSKVAVANAEFRIPLLGTEDGLLNFPFLPTGVAVLRRGGRVSNKDRFPSDAIGGHHTGALRGGVEHPSHTQQAYYPCADRVPVFSTGLSFRFNLMGYAIMEAYIAHPFQRPTKNWVWGFQLAPGW
jgi:hypothetical protein